MKMRLPRASPGEVLKRLEAKAVGGWPARHWGEVTTGVQLPSTAHCSTKKRRSRITVPPFVDRVPKLNIIVLPRPPCLIFLFLIPTTRRLYPIFSTHCTRLNTSDYPSKHYLTTATTFHRHLAHHGELAPTVCVHAAAAHTTDQTLIAIRRLSLPSSPMRPT